LWPQVHRRLLNDDAFGVGEALNESAYGKGLVVRGRHHLVIDSTTSESDSIVLREKELAWNLLNPPCILVTPAGGKSFDEWRNDYRMRVIMSDIDFSIFSNICRF
jgi:lysosomal alpha-mannosidase